MDLPSSPNPHAPDSTDDAHAVLAEVTCRWGDGVDQGTTALVVHAAPGVLVLEASDARLELPPPGTPLRLVGITEHLEGRVAEHGRGGRFLVSIGKRPTRRASRMRVALPGWLRSATLGQPVAVEIVDLTTGGARVRGVELPVGAPVTLDFTPPRRHQSVTVRGVVAHGTHKADRPWIGVAFKLVALQGGR